jgi:RNA polymerase sigma factor (sigma-70 family)
MKMTNQANTITDLEVIRRILGGEVVLFELLIKRYNSSLYKTGRSYGFNHHDVEDLMQETYINAYSSLSKFEGRSSFKTWIIKIMLNQCHHKAKKFSFRNERPREISQNENFIPMFSSKADPNNVMVNRELTTIIQQAIFQIPIDYRMVFSLRELNGLSIAETAEALDITPSNVKVRLNRAKTMLRKQLEQIYTVENLFEYNLIYCDKMVEKVMSTINRLN